MAETVDKNSLSGFRLSYLQPQSPNTAQFFLGPPLKLNSFSEKELPEKMDKLNVYLRIKNNHHAGIQVCGIFILILCENLCYINNSFETANFVLLWMSILII